MVITFVMDQYGEVNNGTTVTAMRFAELLKLKGHTVKIITASKSNEEGVYVLPEYKIPIFNGIVQKQGMRFADPDSDIIREAIAGSDVVHMLMPFMVQNATFKIAEDMRIATTAAFHVQPENFTYSVGFGKVKIANKLLYTFFRKKFYNKFNHIHCPSQMMKDLLLENKYLGNIHAISNGVVESFGKRDVAKPDELKDKYVILMIGRYSKEKRQDLIIKAIGNSKYNDKIQLILAGKGPTKESLIKLSQKHLKNPAQFVFLPKSELIDLINYSDLYVHSSDAESEAISCIEAIMCGLVPVISDSPICATKQFAISPHSLFNHGDYKNLQEKIEWMIEHPQEKAELSVKYMEYAKNFTIDKCVDALVGVFEDAIKENKLRWENVDKENNYLLSLDQKSKKTYFKNKEKYEKELIKRKTPDFTDNFINTLVK